MYTIKPDNLTSAFDVFCDQTTAGGGWTVFQKRMDGSVDFFLNWSDYKVGFGDPSGEVWLGNEKIHHLTRNYNNTVLRVDLEDFEGNTTYAEYDMFGVLSENDKYKLIVGNYSGMAFFLHIALLKLECEREMISKKISYIGYTRNSRETFHVVTVLVGPLLSGHPN